MLCKNNRKEILTCPFGCLWACFGYILIKYCQISKVLNVYNNDVFFKNTFMKIPDENICHQENLPLKLQNTHYPLT